MRLGQVDQFGERIGCGWTDGELRQLYAPGVALDRPFPGRLSRPVGRNGRGLRHSRRDSELREKADRGADCAAIEPSGPMSNRHLLCFGADRLCHFNHGAAQFDSALIRACPGALSPSRRTKVDRYVLLSPPAMRLRNSELRNHPSGFCTAVFWMTAVSLYAFR